MDIVVYKFGGKSLRNEKRIYECAKNIALISKTKKVIVVVSARGNTTQKIENNFLLLKKQLFQSNNKNRKTITKFLNKKNILKNIQNLKLSNPKLCKAKINLLYQKSITKQCLDFCLATGEMQSVAHFCLALKMQNVKCNFLNFFESGIECNNNFGNAKITNINTTKILLSFQTSNICVIAGFASYTKNGCIATLGKGGSDLVAVCIAQSLNAKCYLCKDENGILNKDPKIFKNSKQQFCVGYDDLLFHSANSKVVQQKCLIFAKNNNFSFFVQNANFKTKPTYICNSPCKNAIFSFSKCGKNYVLHTTQNNKQTKTIFCSFSKLKKHINKIK